MVGTTTTTPIEQINIHNQNDVFIARDDDHMNGIIKKVIEIKIEEIKVAFMEKFIENIKKELKNLPPSKHYGMYKYMKGTYDPLPLREQIIKTIKVRRGNGVFELTISHPLALALNNGTGIYGPTKTPIKPTTKQYMFIPGPQYAKNFMMARYKKQGFSAEDALSRYEYHLKRTTVGKRQTARIKTKIEKTNISLTKPKIVKKPSSY